MAFLLSQLLTRNAERTPEKTAVVCRGDRLTYAELECQSNRLARLLLDAGVRPGDRVGLYFPKSVRSLVSMFGVLKAGAAYVPVDPQAPTARVATVLANCEAAAVITTAQHLVRLGTSVPPSVRATVLADTRAVDSSVTGRVLPWTALDAHLDGPVSLAGRVESDLAYILYTSGSTGVPKGVMLTHRNALTFIDWCAATFAIRGDDRLSNHAPLHFDLSVFDVYNAIGAGASVHVVDEETAVFPASVARFMAAEALTVWYSVPSALVQLLQRGNLAGDRVRSLRLVLYAGEPFPVKHLRALTEALPQVPIYNLYGPTETNVCTYYRVPTPLPAGIDQVPIGRACDNTEAIALGSDGRPVTAGEEGELYVRGPSVTPGYWGDRDKTASVVVPNRARPELGDRTYRTGDIVRSDSDGNFLFVGRRDHMIKSRGYRIELGEIEAALYAHPGTVEAAAVPLPDEEIGNRIVAAVTLQPGARVTSEELTRHCAERIPHYMIPERIELRTHLPKTSTGKVDRRQLAADLIG
jgi:amino acid adenylation domain-containing protein